MIVPMIKVRILGPRRDLPDVLRVVQNVGVLHLATASTQTQLAGYTLRPLESRRRRQFGRLLDDLEQCLSQMETSADLRATEAPQFPRWARLARRTRVTLDRLRHRQASLEEERAMLERYHALFETLESLLRSRGKAPGSSPFYFVLRPEQRGALVPLRRALGELVGDAFELFEQPLPAGETAVLLLVPASFAPRIERLLSENRLQEIPVPSGYGTSLVDAVSRMRQREQEIPGELKRVADDRSDLARRVGPELVRARRAVRDALAWLDALPLSAVTQHAFLMEGWAPAQSEARLKDALARACGDTIALEVLAREQWSGELAPVELRNPRLFRPFEVVTRMLPLPRYGSIDPTPFVAVFFPMFFGLMLGDAGYGIAVAILAWVLRKKSEPSTTLRSVSEIMGACALFSIAFGVLFGEFFGDLGHRWFGLAPLWFDRAEAIIPFLGLAVALGLVHVLLGLLLGTLTSLRSHPREAIGRGLSGVMLLLILAALLAAFEVLPKALLTPAVIALLVAFPVLVVIEGIVAPIELLTTIGHVLSYARIMALGTASVMLAIVANQMSGAMGSVLVGALFGLLFHLVNFALGLFSPTIHALRLHYVEFFGTFYSPGGTRYTPLRRWSPRPAGSH